MLRIAAAFSKKTEVPVTRIHDFDCAEIVMPYSVCTISLTRVDCPISQIPSITAFTATERTDK